MKRVLFNVLACHASHLIYEELNVPLTLNAPILASLETITLAQPISVLSNHKYAIMFEFENASITRNYMGATGLNGNDCALVHTSSNVSWASPIGNYPTYSGFDFFLRINNALDVISLVLALQNVALPRWTDSYGTGFGQTFNSFSETSISSFGLLLASGATSANAVSVKIQVYDLSSFPVFENIAFPFYAETNNPTTNNPSSRSPTSNNPTSLSPTSNNPTSLNPTTNNPTTNNTTTNNPTTNNPTSLSPTSNNPTTNSPTTNYLTTNSPTSHNLSLFSLSPSLPPSTSTSTHFTPVNCEGISIPTIYVNMRVLCNCSSVQKLEFVTDEIVVGDIVHIVIFDNNTGTELIVKDLSIENEILLFIPFSSNTTPKNATCVWISETGFETSGCYQDPELISKEGIYCKTNHLTAFSLILRYYEKGPTIIRRTLSQYVCILLATCIAVIAGLQMTRVYQATKTITMVGTIHFAILCANIIIIVMFSIFPELQSSPAVFVFLSSIVTSIELSCYICLVYIWTAPFLMLQVKITWRLKWGLQIFLSLTMIVNNGIPLILITNPDTYTGIALARAGCYVMATLMLIVCCALGVRGLKLRAQLLDVESQNQNQLECLPILPTRILIGTTSLTMSMTTQAIFLILSVLPDNNNSTDFLELGFGIPVFVTYATLLFLFYAGITEAVLKATKRSSNLSLSHSSTEPRLPGRSSRIPSRDIQITRHLESASSSAAELHEPETKSE